VTPYYVRKRRNRSVGPSLRRLASVRKRQSADCGIPSRYSSRTRVRVASGDRLEGAERGVAEREGAACGIGRAGAGRAGTGRAAAGEDSRGAAERGADVPRGVAGNGAET